MNKVITDGIVLMPPPFSAGLAQWSRTDGTPGSPGYQGHPDVALVPIRISAVVWRCRKPA